MTAAENRTCIISLACFSGETQKMQAFFFLIFSVPTPNSGSGSQALLAETLETVDKNRDDFHCMQTSLLMSMRFIFGDD